MVARVKQALINHCAPVIMKINPAALFTLPCKVSARYLQKAANCAISVSLLRENDSGVLVIAYNPDMLDNLVLGGNAVCELKKLGYPQAFGKQTIISCLKKRFKNFAQFPHEVGFFLGYPEEDVLGFIQNAGRGYKCCGLWKVYGNVELSRRRFEDYRRCTQCLREVLDKGGDARDLMAAV